MCKDAVESFWDLWQSKTKTHQVALPDSNPSMDAMMVDDAYSKMLDPKLEQEIMVSFLKDIDGEGLTGPIGADFGNMDDYVEDWIYDNVDADGKQTVTGAESGKTLTDIKMPGLNPTQTNCLIELATSLTIESV